MKLLLNLFNENDPRVKDISPDAVLHIGDILIVSGVSTYNEPQSGADDYLKSFDSVKDIYLEAIVNTENGGDLAYVDYVAKNNQLIGINKVMVTTEEDIEKARKIIRKYNSISFAMINAEVGVSGSAFCIMPKNLKKIYDIYQAPFYIVMNGPDAIFTIKSGIVEDEVAELANLSDIVKESVLRVYDGKPHDILSWVIYKYNKESGFIDPMYEVEH